MIGAGINDDGKVLMLFLRVMAAHVCANCLQILNLLVMYRCGISVAQGMATFET